MADCPATYDPSGDGAWKATCQGSLWNNGFYGHGQVDANAAVLG